MKVYVYIETWTKSATKSHEVGVHLDINDLTELRQKVIEYCFDEYFSVTTVDISSYRLICRTDGTDKSIPHHFFDKKPLFLEFKL